MHRKTESSSSSSSSSLYIYIYIYVDTIVVRRDISQCTHLKMNDIEKWFYIYIYIYEFLIYRMYRMIVPVPASSLTYRVPVDVRMLRELCAIVVARRKTSHVRGFDQDLYL
jgi:hypothetical protein